MLVRTGAPWWGIGLFFLGLMALVQPKGTAELVKALFEGVLNQRRFGIEKEERRAKIKNSSQARRKRNAPKKEQGSGKQS